MCTGKSCLTYGCYYKYMQRVSRAGFTLIEMSIAMAMFGVLSMMIITVYFNATNTARKLSMTRELSETAREITERIAEDVKNRWISLRKPEFDSSRTYPLWNTLDYAWNGNEVLILGLPGNEHIYAYWKKSAAWLDPCDSVAANDLQIHCGLYLKEGSDYYNLVDSFVPEESKKRVKIESLRFYISGNSLTTNKVTLNFTLSLMPRIWVPISLVWTTKLHIQTTFSERSWKE